MREANYWTRLRAQRLSRRRLLAGAVAVGAGAAGLAAAGCGGGEEGPAAASPTPAAGGQPLLTTVGNRGGTFRGFNYDSLVLDTRDPHQTRLGPMYNIQSYIFSKVLNYFDEIGRDLGQSYLKNGRNRPWLGGAYWFANTWLDSSDPEFEGRPS